MDDQILGSTSFVIDEVERNGDRLIEADAGDAYLKYVLRKGFFGTGPDAHGYSYNVLKNNHFKRVVSQFLINRTGKFFFPFLNGARRKESARRMKTMVLPFHFTEAYKNNIWVNLINEWDRDDCLDYLNGNSIKRNPVSVQLCRSGECMCGTMQTKEDRVEASCIFPKWGEWIDNLEKVVKEKHGFGWGVKTPKPINPAQLNLFQPMCVGCTKNVVNGQ